MQFSLLSIPTFRIATTCTGISLNATKRQTRLLRSSSNLELYVCLAIAMAVLRSTNLSQVNRNERHCFVWFTSRRRAKMMLLSSLSASAATARASASSQLRAKRSYRRSHVCLQHFAVAATWASSALIVSFARSCFAASGDLHLHRYVL